MVQILTCGLLTVPMPMKPRQSYCTTPPISRMIPIAHTERREPSFSFFFFFFGFSFILETKGREKFGGVGVRFERLRQLCSRGKREFRTLQPGDGMAYTSCLSPLYRRRLWGESNRVRKWIPHRCRHKALDLELLWTGGEIKCRRDLQIQIHVATDCSGCSGSCFCHSDDCGCSGDRPQSSNRTKVLITAVWCIQTI